VLSRTDLAELGYPRRAVDAIFRAVAVHGSGVQVIPGYSRPLILVRDFLAERERCAFRDDRVLP
jgi:hypothetical protein